MTSIRTTPYLHRFFPDLAEQVIEIAGPVTLEEIVHHLNARFPGLAGYLIDDDGSLRKVE